MPYKGLYFALWTNCRRIHTAFFCPKGWISSSPTFQPFRFTKSSYPKLLFISELPGSAQRVQRKPRYLNPWPGREAQGQVAASGSGRIRSGPSQCSTNAPVGKTTGGQDIPLRCLSVTSARHVVFSCLVCASIGSVSEQRILVEILGRPTGRESCVVISNSRFSTLVPGNFQTRFVFLFLHSEILYVDSRTCFSEKSN
jgi:hypothetical protein